MKASKINMDEAYGADQHSTHRRPRDAGSADRYYGRPCNPNFSFKGFTYNDEQMTPEQIAEYMQGFENETDRKDWGCEAQDDD